MVKAFDCGPESPRFKSHLLLHKVKSFLYPSSPTAERAKKVKTKTFAFFCICCHEYVRIYVHVQEGDRVPSHPK